MPEPPAHEASRDALSGHLEGLFALAQVITASPEDGARLVEHTVERARRRGVPIMAAEPGAVERARVDLYHMLLELHAESASAATDAAVVPPGAAEPAAMGSVKTRLVERFVDTVVPAAFASLPARDRILLLLCDVQRMSCAEAGRVLDLDAELAGDRLDDARRHLEHLVRAGATDLERGLLDALPEGAWRRAALRRMSEQELAAVPPTLRPTLPSDATPVERPTGRRRSESGGFARSARRAVAVFVIIGLAGLLGYVFSIMTTPSPDLNLISLSADRAGAVHVAFATASAEQGERFIRDRLGRRITIPSISGAALQGISIEAVIDGAEAPVLVYGGTDGAASIVVYVYSYAFLDAHERAVRLSTDVLGQIESEGRFDLHDLGDERALVWRRSDDIYIAVTGGDAETLRDRITFPS